MLPLVAGELCETRKSLHDEGVKLVWARRALAIVVCAALLACGPSFQVIYEGNARFEHCYALEEYPQRTLTEKVACWRDWSERYTYGQTQDRVHYATARYVALSQSTLIPTDEAMMMAAPGMTTRDTSILAPTPSSALVPPPKVLGDDPETVGQRTGRITQLEHPRFDAISIPPAVRSASPAALGAPKPLPDVTCGDGCGATFRACGATCSDGGVAACASRCDGSYRSCMRLCFR
jgi:hypothetical protein